MSVLVLSKKTALFCILIIYTFCGAILWGQFKHRNRIQAVNFFLLISDTENAKVVSRINVLDKELFSSPKKNFYRTAS